jgi:large subunit ribosomal protein L6
VSRIAKNPIAIPSGVRASIQDNCVIIEGSHGTERCLFNPRYIQVLIEEDKLRVQANDHRESKVNSGTISAHLRNAVDGVFKGIEKGLKLVGVGYRAEILSQSEGKFLKLMLGYSKPILYKIPQGIVLELPSNTEIRVKGSSIQLVGQVAAEIRSFRPPEPYKGKGILYLNEKIKLKETKKK